LLANKIIDAIQANKIYATWLKPIRFDNNIVVIGAGGLVAAYIAVTVKAKVTLIESINWAEIVLIPVVYPQKS
jgi:ribulose 1,5-bisphosphate synthetase/thiazole synthase